MDLKTITEIVDNIVTSGAIIIGGVWAYFKFIRGRTFAHRAELDVSLSLERSPGLPYLCATVSLKNTGLSKLPLNDNMKVIRLFRATSDRGGPVCAVTWERILTLPLLKPHEWLETQETVTDTVVYNICGAEESGPPCVAYQVEAVVGAPRNLLTRRGTWWRSSAIIFMPPVGRRNAEPIPKESHPTKQIMDT